MGTATGEKPVLLEISDGVAVITLNRPEAYNAFDSALGEALLEAVIACDEDPRVRAVLMTGSGSAFCAGGDIREMQRHAAQEGGASRFLKRLTVPLHAVVATLAHMPKPVVAAVNGAAAGAGFSIAMAGDIVLAADSARFTVAYTAIGLSPDGSLTFSLPRLIGPKLAFELAASNRTLAAAEARALGIVNQVLPAAELLAGAKAYAKTLAAGPTLALGHAKRLIALSAAATLETQMELERQAIGKAGHTEDFKEGIAAFLAKRPAAFRGR